MNLDIGAKLPVNGDQVFLVGRCFSSAEAPFVLLYDAVKARRAKRNIRKIDPTKVVTALGGHNFVEIEAPHWGTVWFRTSEIRDIRELPEDSLATSQVKFGAFVLFKHDPEPPDEHAGFMLYGIKAGHASKLLKHTAAE